MNQFFPKIFVPLFFTSFNFCSILYHIKCQQEKLILVMSSSDIAKVRTDYNFKSSYFWCSIARNSLRLPTYHTIIHFVFIIWFLYFWLFLLNEIFIKLVAHKTCVGQFLYTSINETVKFLETVNLPCNCKFKTLVLHEGNDDEMVQLLLFMLNMISV